MRKEWRLILGASAFCLMLMLVGFVENQPKTIAVRVESTRDEADIMNGYFEQGWKLKQIEHTDFDGTQVLMEKGTILIFEK